MKRAFAAAALVALCTASQGYAGLISSQTDSNPTGTNVVDDGTINPGEYSTVYFGGGAGFGGTLGAGSLHVDTDGVMLYFGFQPGNFVNDNVVIHLDTRTGGFTDNDMNDTADPGRNLLSNLTASVDDPFPILPDFGIVMGQFGQVSFELAAGGNNSLIFVAFENDQTGNSNTLAREFEIPLATIGNPSAINFFVSYGSDTNYMSNESIPAEAFNAGPNPGTDNAGTNTAVVRNNYNEFVVPEPASIGLLGMSLMGLMRRRRSR
jgi:hypothetical protein